MKFLKNLNQLLRRASRQDRERGAITIAESLIVIAIGITVLVVWAQAQAVKTQQDNARQAGRAIAAYARAASTMLAENPPAADTTLNITDLQDCSTAGGARFLSCSDGPATRIPFASTDSGAPLTYGDLEIDVTVTDAGATGTIDLGVFRAGNDGNEDGLSDSRPDLAALALTEAREETGAGVLDFFNVDFVREDPTGLIYDPDADSFDQAAIDDLARLNATVGALAGNAPFLRLDGSNQMTGGITFSNSMAIKPEGTDLAFTGAGNVKVAAASLNVENRITTPTLTATDISASQAVTIGTALGAKGAGFDHLDQRGDITDLETNVTANTAGLESLGAEIEANKTKFDDYWTADEVGEKFYEKAEVDTRIGGIEDVMVTADTVTDTVMSELSAACSPSLATRDREMAARGYTNPRCRGGADREERSRIVTRTYKQRNSTDFTCYTHAKEYWKRISCSDVR